MFDLANILFWVSCFGLVVINPQKAVKGSRQRYTLSSVHRLLSYTWMLSLLMLSFETFLQQRWVLTGTYLAGLGVAIIVEWWYQKHTDNDDWFKGRSKKIITGVKNLFLHPKTVASTT